jgi:hypothetical protein
MILHRVQPSHGQYDERLLLMNVRDPRALAYQVYSDSPYDDLAGFDFRIMLKNVATIEL